MRDQNICECGLASAVDARRCSHCGAALFAPARGLTLWLLEGTSAALVAKLASRLERRFRREVHISPSRIATGPCRRALWKGHSANVFLNQVQRRIRRGELVLGVTERNIVPGATWNFLFGLAYLNGRSAVMSLRPLLADGASARKVLARAEKIAVHELGHALGLDHHAYEDGADCVMTGDVEHDCLENIDIGTAEFCAVCARRIC